MDSKNQIKLKKVLEIYQKHPDFQNTNLTCINQRAYGNEDAPLHIAVRMKPFEDIVDLIDLGASVNLAGDLGYTPLHYAVQSCKLNVATLLLENGADPSVKNEFGETAYDFAKMANSTKMEKLLKESRIIENRNKSASKKY